MPPLIARGMIAAFRSPTGRAIAKKAVQKAVPVARKAANIGARMSKETGMKVKHWMDNARATTHGGKGSSTGRSGTSYKPYR